MEAKYHLVTVESVTSDHKSTYLAEAQGVAKHDLYPRHPPLAQICVLGGLDLLGEEITDRAPEFVGELPNSVLKTEEQENISGLTCIFNLKFSHYW